MYTNPIWRTSKSTTNNYAEAMGVNWNGLRFGIKSSQITGTEIGTIIKINV